MFKNIKYNITESLKEHRLGELLVKRGYITEAQLNLALQQSKHNSEKIGKTLVKLGYISSFQLYRKIIAQWQLRISTAVVILFINLIAPVTAYSDSSVSFGNNYKLNSQITTNLANNIQQPKLKGFKEFKSDDLTYFTKWTSAMDRYNRQIEKMTIPSSRILMWKDKLDQLAGKPVMEQIEEVNKFINRHKYVEDIDNYGVSDYWATPLEFFEKGGDCEDFAIAKYISLKALGFSPKQMRITIVKDIAKNIHHAVLTVNVGGETLILDNQNKDVQLASNINIYEPIFSLNSQNWWLHEKA